MIVESNKGKSKATQGENCSFAINDTENEKCISLVFLFLKKINTHMFWALELMMKHLPFLAQEGSGGYETAK